jgi:hypothetical protein
MKKKMLRRQKRAGAEVKRKKEAQEWKEERRHRNRSTISQMPDILRGVDDEAEGVEPFYGGDDGQEGINSRL